MILGEVDEGVLRASSPRIAPALRWIEGALVAAAPARATPNYATVRGARLAARAAVLERTHVGAAGAFGRADRRGPCFDAARGVARPRRRRPRTAARLGRAARASDEPHGRARGGRLAVRALPRAPPLIVIWPALIFLATS